MVLGKLLACFGAQGLEEKQVTRATLPACVDASSPSSTPPPQPVPNTCPVKGPSCTPSGPVCGTSAGIRSPDLQETPPHGGPAARQQHPSLDPCFEAKILGSMGFSLALVSSDAKDVLYQRIGTDGAAALLLNQALQYKSLSHALNTPQVKGTDRADARDYPPQSFLAAVLGPDLEALALETARQGRCWKGTISVQLPAAGLPSCSDAFTFARPSGEPVPPTNHDKGIPSLPDEDNLLNEASRPAADRQLAPEHPSAGASLEKTAVTPAHAKAATGTGGPHSEKSVRWSPQTNRQDLIQQQEALQHTYRDFAAGSAFTKSTHSSTPACRLPRRGSDAHVQDPVEKEVDKSKAKAKSAVSAIEIPSPGKPMVQRSKSSSSFQTRYRSSLLMSERAVQQLMSCGSGEESRTLALLKSITQVHSTGGKTENQSVRASTHGAQIMGQSTTSPVLSKYDSAFSFVPQHLSIESSSTPCSQKSVLRDTGLRISPQSDDTSTGRVTGCVFIHSSSQEVPSQQFAYQAKSIASAFKAPRTASVQLPPNFNNLASSSKRRLPARPPISPPGRSHSMPAALHLPRLCIPGNVDQDEAVQKSEHPRSRRPLFKPSSYFCNMSDEDGLSESRSFGFDVMVSMMEPTLGPHRSPLLVTLCNCTDHMRARSAFLHLAESQLELMASTMPSHAVQFLAMESTKAVPASIGQLARKHTGVTLLFMDIVGFTLFSKSVEPEQVMALLNTLFSLFDKLVDEHGVHKVETAGDCYIVSGGIMSPNPTSTSFGFAMEDQDPAESAARVMGFAKGLLEAAKQVKMPDTNQPVRVRVGMHTGDVVSGLIGSKLPKFSLFGNSMNTASRMESTGVPGRIHVSEATWVLLPDEHWEPTGGVQVKGKGQMQTFLWIPAASQPPSQQRHVKQAIPAESCSCHVFKQACSVVQHAQGEAASCPLPALLLDLYSASSME